MKQITTILFSFLLVFTFLGTAEGQVRINEIRADDDGTDDVEFVELVGISGTDITGYQIKHVNGSGGSTIFTHTIGSFTIPDDGDTDSEANLIGYYVLGAGGFSTGTDDSVSTALQNGPDGIILYDGEGNVIDAVAWDGAGDINSDVTTSGNPSADNYLHVTSSDEGNDNSLQAPDDVVGDDGSGWAVIPATLGAINQGQTSGSIILETSIKAEPASHVTSFIATGAINSIDLSWTDATGSPAPDAYLVKVHETDYASISAPVDGNAESNDTDFSDGSGTLNVTHGVESASFTGLDETTNYYFKIFPYTNTGSDIDYKTDGTVPEAHATTLETPLIVLNEFLADPGGNDTNGDGAVSSDDDEFIEFVNTGSSDLDVSGWKIEDEIGTRYTFPSSTVLKPKQGIVIFGGGDPSGDFGGSIVKTTSSLSLNNTGDSIILKNDSGVEILSHTYSSSTSGESKTRNPDLTGSFTSHSSAFNGTSFSPGTRVDGFAFHPRVEITGNEGWRILSSPTANSTYKDLLDPIWTQCSDNSNYNGNLCDTDPDTQPNVQIYNGSEFEGLNDLNTNMNRGEGFIVYVYADDNFDGTADAFPKTLELFESVSSDDVNATLTSGTDSWTLLGNPYNSSINWGELNPSGLTGTVYVYDHSYGNVSGDDVEETNVGGGYRTWNGSSGSLADGKIAPFQGFWVQNSGLSPSLTFKESAKTTGGTFYTKENENVISIRLKSEMENMFSEAFLSFTESGQLGDDKNDGLKLSPLDFRDYISLSTQVEGTQMDINNLPVELYNPVEIPLHVKAFEAVESGWTLMGGEVTLSWPEMNNIPSEWEITLTDTRLNKTIDLKNANNYVFEAEGNRGKIPGKKPFSPFNPEPLQKEKAVSDARFLITINPNVPDGLIDNDIPDHFTLEQNYPNPFNPTTNIQFEIAVSSDVTLNIYNVMGQRVATLVNEVKAPGTYEISWDARDMASGIYYYRLRASGEVFNRQMTLIK